MPRPGRTSYEKAKDFKGSMKRLIKNLNKWKYIMIMALVLAFISAMLALIAPNKLSKFADTISEGLVPNTKKLMQISEKINSNFSSCETQNKLLNIEEHIELTTDEKIIIDELKSKIITQEDIKKLLTLKKETLTYLLEDILIDKTTITKDDQYNMLILTTKMDKTNQENNIGLIDELP